MTGIYLITNNINGKYYVGQSIDIQTRWYNHKKDCFNPNASSYKTYFYQALRKYGVENFSFDIIEECKEEELNEKEIYWIKVLNANKHEIGYNTTDGGDGVRGYWDKPVYQYDLQGNFIAEYKSISDAKRQTGITTIACCCIGITKSGGGYLWSYVKHKKLPEYKQNHFTVEVHQYSLDGTYLQSFSSIIEAAVISGVRPGNIVSCISKSTQIRAGNYMWTRTKTTKLPPYKRNGRKSFPVFQKDKEGNIVAQYESANEAGRKTGINSGNICRCCNGKCHMAGGYKWEYINKVKI